MSRGSEAVIKWRRRLKAKAVAAMGGCCQCCGYNRSMNAMEFHHINPFEKDFSMGKIRAAPKSLDKIIIELKKCILVCANCHREIHDNLLTIPEIYATVDKTILMSEYDLRRRHRAQTALSPNVTKEKLDRRKIRFSCDELMDLLVDLKGNKSALARVLHVSETAIRKKLRGTKYEEHIH